MILNTRPAIYRDTTHAAFASLGLPVTDAPLLVPQAIDAVLPEASAFDALILTSQVALHHFPEDATWRAKTVFAVGAATAAAARHAGFSNVVCTGQDARDLAAAFRASDTTRALYPSAAEVASDLSDIFPDRVVRLPVYRMEAVNGLPDAVIELILAADRVFLPILSRRSGEAAAEALSAAGITRANARIFTVGISMAALNVIARAPWTGQTVADAPTLASIAEEIGRQLPAVRRAA